MTDTAQHEIKVVSKEAGILVAEIDGVTHFRGIDMVRAYRGHERPDIQSGFNTEIKKRFSDKCLKLHPGAPVPHGLYFQTTIADDSWKIITSDEVLRQVKNTKFAGMAAVAKRRAECRDIGSNMATFKQELLAIDGLNPNHMIWKTGILAGALVIPRKDPVRGLDFFTKFNSNLGWQGGGECDGVCALTNLAKEKRIGQGGGNSKTLNHCQKTISCFEAYIAGRKYKAGSNGAAPRASKLAGYAKK